MCWHLIKHANDKMSPTNDNALAEINITIITNWYQYLFPAGKAVFWHSSAHIMGEAMERHYGGHLCYGPPIEEGYYYDMFLDGRLACLQT